MSDALHRDGVDRSLLRELSADDEAALHTHLSRCPGCRTRYEEGLELLRAVRGQRPTAGETERALLRLTAALEPVARPAPWASLLERLMSALVWRPLVPAGAVASLALVALLLGTWLLPGGRGGPAGRLVASRGEVTIAGKAPVPGAPLLAGQRVSTGAKGRATLAISRGHLRLYPGTTLSLDGAGRLSLHEGLVWCEIEPGSGGFLVATPEANVAVLGTVFGVEHTGGETVAGVARGKVSVAGREGGAVQLGPGQRSRVKAGAVPGHAEEFDIEAELRGREAGGAKSGRTVDRAIEDLFQGE